MYFLFPFAVHNKDWVSILNELYDRKFLLI